MAIMTLIYLIVKNNTIKYKWSNGLVEWHVNIPKNKKIYGRAGFELPRRKVILYRLN